MSVDLIERPVGLPDGAVWPQPNLNDGILFSVTEPVMPVAPSLGTVVLAIADPYEGISDLSDDEATTLRQKNKELDRQLEIIGGIFSHPEFRLPWDASRRGHYIGLIYSERMQFTHKRLLELGTPKKLILWIDHHGHQVIEGEEDET
jgi:hypothetical protein